MGEWGFEVRDRIGFIFGTGFPKSHSIGKAIDRKKIVECPECNGEGIIDRPDGKFIGFCNCNPHEGGGWYLVNKDDPRCPLCDAKVSEIKEQMFPFPCPICNGQGKVRGAERETKRIKYSSQQLYCKEGQNDRPWMEKVKEVGYHELAGDIPVTPEAQTWVGWGSALKPAVEDWWLLRKPLSEDTIAQNVLRWGTGGLNIDGARVPTSDNLGGGVLTGSVKFTNDGWNRPWMDDTDAVRARQDRAKEQVAKAESLGRWPAHLVHDGSEEVVGLFPVTGASKAAPRGGTNPNPMDWGGGRTDGDIVKGHNDKGGSAARFFTECKLDRYYYGTKASKRDRDEGLDELDDGILHRTNPGGIENDPKWALVERKNTHPTAKSTDLMRWLCRLITPPNGIVLDTFMGSGSTGKAAMLEGFRFIGIEKDEEYFKIACARIAYGAKKYNYGAMQPSLFGIPDDEDDE